MTLASTNLLGQVHPTPTGNHGTTDFTTNNFTPPNNSLLVVGVSIIENSGSTTDPLSSITVSGGGWTYTGGPGVSVSPTSFPTATKIFTAPVGTGASMTLTIGTGGRSIGEYSVTVVAWTGYNTGAPTGATATGSQNGGFTGPPTPFSITLSGAPASTSNVFAVAGMDKSAAGATPGTTGTCTEVDDVTNTDWGGLESQIRTNSTSTTVDWADLRSGGGALFNVAAVAIEIVAAAAASSVTPQPAVVTQPVRPSITQATILRSTLADPPVLTTQPPIVATRPAQLPAPTTTLAIRSTLADPPVLTTPPPQVITRPSPVVTPPPTLLSRSSLQDYSAAAPIVVSRPAAAPPATTTFLSRASLADTVAPTASTPPPIVVSGTTVRPPAGSATVLRSTLADPPVLTTPGPLIVSAPTKAALPGPVISLRGSLVDLATPAPIIVTAPSPVSRTGPAFLSRSSLADAPVVTGVATPCPIVITFNFPPPRAPLPQILSAFRPGAPAAAGQISGDPVPYPGTDTGPVWLAGQEESGAVSAGASASFAVSAGIQ